MGGRVMTNAAQTPAAYGEQMAKYFRPPKGPSLLISPVSKLPLQIRRSPALRELVARVWSGGQAEILRAYPRGSGLFAYFRRHRPDITLMDLRLPGTNGTDALIAIRGEFPHARIIMLSTSDSDSEIQRTLRTGAAGTC